MLTLFSCYFTQIHALDTLAIQDFELSPVSPTWIYNGTPTAFSTGYSGPNAAPPNSPLGIGGSRAWNTTSVSDGNPVTFDEITIPAGYDSTSMVFRLAAMNLIATTDGPDNLDYVLVEISVNGSPFYKRLRVRGALNNNSTWPYDATGVAELGHLPMTEEVFQPMNSGPQTSLGYSTVKINFPSSVTRVSVRITPRSSSGMDTWLIDNLVLIGYPSTTTFVPTMSQWGFIILCLTSLIVGSIFLRRSKHFLNMQPDKYTSTL